MLLVVQAAVRAEGLLQQKGEQTVLVERVEADSLSVSSFTTLTPLKTVQQVR